MPSKKQLLTAEHKPAKLHRTNAIGSEALRPLQWNAWSRNMYCKWLAAGALALCVSGTAHAIPINVEFNFVPFGNLTANTGSVTTATTISSGAPDSVTQIVANNIGLTSGTVITLTDPTPVTLGSIFTKTFATVFGTFSETLTVTSVTTSLTSRAIVASGLIIQTSGSGGFDPTAVTYTASYTQNTGPGGQINASFNDSTVAVPGPIAGAGLPGLVAAFGGLLAWRRRRHQAA
jgi:hypothetical protein